MTTDLVEFIKEHELKNSVLLGHSMGAKVVMATALENPDMVSKLIAVDMPPVAMKLARSFGTYCDAMKAIEDADPSKQSDADKIMAKYESNVGVRMFLLTNLKRTSDNKLRFRVPYDILGRSLDKIGGFDIPRGLQYMGPTLFIAGGASPYLKPFQEHPKEIKALFPDSKLEVVPGAGHWGKRDIYLSTLSFSNLIFVVHAEKPDAVLNLITSFVDA
jgi:pimeloyl-ACP methyl ester carboxylesterase